MIVLMGRLAVSPQMIFGHLEIPQSRQTLSCGKSSNCSRGESILMTISGQRNASPDFYTISRSHPYWGRRPTNGLMRVFEGLQPGDVVLDPFCGGGTPMITALSIGARVIGSDLNPMAVFLSKVLIQPVSLFALEQTFDTVRHGVAENILSHYAIHCPKCRQEIYFDYLQWGRKDGEDFPEAVKFTCGYCGFDQLHPLTMDEINRQIRLSQVQPKSWFPKKPIRTQRRTNAEFFHELFTGRNLSALSELHQAIEKVTSLRCRETLHYAFTAMLYSCSQMQLFSKKSPSSSPGWSPPRFHLPPERMEKNVWKTFEMRFKRALSCKGKLNSMLGAVRISDSLERFETSSDNAYLHQVDFLRFPFPGKPRVTHVFLDPPYTDDVDYMGFSEFWGSWLGMRFPIQLGRHPGTLSMEDNTARIQELLERVRENTRPSCRVILAYGCKRPNARQLIEKAIMGAGYQIQDTSPIFSDNSQKRKAHEFTLTDRYLLLTAHTPRPTTAEKEVELNALDISASERTELKFFVRISAYWLSCSHTQKLPSLERIRETANDLIRPSLREKFPAIMRGEIREWTLDNQANRKAYNRLCLSFLHLILSKDGFTIVSAENSHFDDSEVPGYCDVRHLPRPTGVAARADFVAAGNNHQRIVFCFLNKEREHTLKQIANRVIESDGDDFRIMHFLVFADHQDMIKHRQVEFVEYWPRGFFLCLGELAGRVVELYGDVYGHLRLFVQKATAGFRVEQKINHFTAEVLSNKPVTGDKNCKHFKIKFEAPELKYVVPGQFVMTDTLSVVERKRIEKRTSFCVEEHASYAKIANLTPHSFLKRPFSIHRVFCDYFKFGYLKNVSLPPNLAPVAHTVFPSRFEIFYQVIENGVGTNELTKVKQGEKIEMLGPLGKSSDLAHWRAQDIREVHLVGGGVGMAPLVFFGQGLKYYSFRVKAFIGVDRIETLLYSARFAPTFSEDPGNAYVYIENLLSIGFVLSDIYVSTEISTKPSMPFRRLPEKNCHVGFVTEQYRSYLDSRENLDGVLVIACGPEPMLRAMRGITLEYDIPMKVLLEKRMACGIGVCMSCVCKTKKNSSTEYSRVCTDGPLFDAKHIDWDQT